MFKISENTKALVENIEGDGGKVVEGNVMGWIEDAIENEKLSKINVEIIAVHLMRNGNDLKTLLEVYSYIDERINR